MADRPKARVCSRSPAGIAGSNPAGGMDVNTVTLSKVWLSLHRFFANLTDDKQLYVNVCCTELYADSSRNVEIGVRN